MLKLPRCMVRTVEAKKYCFPSHLLNYSGWANNQVNRDRFNRRKSKFITYTCGIHSVRKIPKTVKQQWIYRSFWTKEKGGGEMVPSE